MAVGVAAFPNEIAVASTWDRDMAAGFGQALAEEWRGKGLSQIIVPTLNIMRTWHWGRSAETYGEDPFLTGEMASAESAAIQSEHVIAMLKHFAANNQDWDRVGHFPDFHGINEIIPERVLHEIYYPRFRAGIEKAGAGSVMCSTTRSMARLPVTIAMFCMNYDPGDSAAISLQMRSSHCTIRC
jgi:beta-glucosidase